MRKIAAAAGFWMLTCAAPAVVFGATPPGLVAQGDALNSVGNYRAAAEAYRAALDVDPNHPGAHYGLGLLCLRQLKDYSCAAEHLRTHLRLRPEMVVVETWLVEAEEKYFRSRIKEQTRRVRLPSKGFLLSDFHGVEIDPADKTAEDDDEGSTKKEVKKAGEIEIIAFRNLRGSITDIGDEGVTIDVGSEDGVVEGMQFAVYRGEEWAGMLRTTDVAAEKSTCEPIAGLKVSGGKGQGWAFEPGDEVRQREDVLGAGMANEAEVRKKILGWQKEQQGLDREQEDLRDRERQIRFGLSSADSPRKKARLLEELTDLSGEFRSWRQRFSKWVDGVLKMQEDRLAGNPHLASYRRQLKDRYRIESESALWWEVQMGSLKKIMDILADIPEFRSQDEADLFAGRFYDTVYYFQEIQGDVERWQGQDDIYLPMRRFEEEEFAERLLNFARYSLLKGKERRAARLFRSVAEKNPDEAFALAAREGLEQARLKLIMKGEKAEIEEESAFAPPLATAWEYPCDDLRGEMRTVDGLLYMFCSSGAEDGGAGKLTALDLEEGKSAWQFGFPGYLGGDWHVEDGEILFASDRGVLYRLDAGSGRLLGEFSPGNTRNSVSRILRSGNRIVWLMGSGSGGTHRIYSIDLLNRKNLHLVEVEGDVTAALMRNTMLLIAATGRNRESPGKDSANSSNQFNILPHIPLGRRMPKPSSADPPQALLAAIGSYPAVYKAWGVASGSIQWMGKAGDLLVFSNVEAPKKNREPVSHICMVSFEGGKIKPWRLSIPGRDAVAAMMTEGDRAYIVLRDGYLLAVDLKKQIVEWKADLPVPAAGDFRWTRFLASTGNDLVLWCGSLEPPWKVYTVDREEGVINAEVTITDSLRTKPVLAGGYLYTAGRNGALVARSVTRESDRWSFAPRKSEGHFLPRPLGELESMAPGGDGTVTWDDRQRFLFREAFSSGYPGNREPLFFDGKRLVYWSGPEKLLYALEAR